QTASAEKAFGGGRRVVDHEGKAESVVRPVPSLALDRQAEGPGLVDVGELEGFIATLVPTGASEEADILPDLLFDINADAAAVVGFAYRGNVSWLAGLRCQRGSLGIVAHPAVRQKSEQPHGARLPIQLVSLFQFQIELELVEEVRIERLAVRHP